MTGRIKHWRYLLFLAVFASSAVPLSFVARPQNAVIVGFDLALAAFVLSCVSLWRVGNADVMRREAGRDDTGQVLLLVLTGLISIVVLVALSHLILDKADMGLGGVALTIFTLLASWTFTNIIFAFHYARLYYAPANGGDHEGLDFPGSSTPDFSDFVNFAFVIGMTCQTADINITKTPLRRVATFHGLFAFAFNLGILALVVNVLASSAG